MPSVPWWIERVDRLLAPTDLGGLGAGALWHLSERLQFIHENVEPALLEQDFESLPDCRTTWSTFLRRESDVLVALREVVGRIAASLRRGELDADAFRSIWQRLGFLVNAEGGGTPADDYLDAVSQVPRITLGEARPPSGMLNMASRAERIADFIEVTRPGIDDSIVDIGSGNGKFALTVAASTSSRVRGIEYGGTYVAAARASAAFLGTSKLDFIHADVRDVDLSMGNIFYLYHPFQGEVALSVARALGRLGRERAITVYLLGPTSGFGEHFLHEVEDGALSLSERRGEFSQVLVLRSP
ncbi:MAG: hypothetical protein WBV82_00785 [Myxococcaceae bacterium]